MIAGVRARVPGAKIIVFARGSGLDGHARVVPETAADAVGVDWSVDLKALRDRVPATTVTQGNVHPETLIAGGAALDAAVDGVLAATDGLPRTSSTSDGITPQTPIAHVERMLARLRAEAWTASTPGSRPGPRCIDLLDGGDALPARACSSITPPWRRGRTRRRSPRPSRSWNGAF